MKRQKPLTILSYAVNGIGLGHLTRLIAINTEIRRICALVNQPLIALFLTTSEADTLAHRHSFPAYKLPSMTLADEGRIPRTLYKSLSRHWIWNTFGLWKPDITLVDTFPAGSFGELPAILQDSPKNIFIHRAVKKDEEKKTAFKEALRLYDRILRIKEPYMEVDDMIDIEQNDACEDIPPIIVEKRYSNDIHIQQRRYIIVFGGGGGDEYSESFWQSMARVAEMLPDKLFIFAVGMLFRGTTHNVHNIHYIRTELGREYYDNCEFAISAGGFNSVYELLHYKIPTIFFSQQRKFDDQQKRIERLQQHGLCFVGSFTRTEECIEHVLFMTESRCDILRKNLHDEKWTIGNVHAARLVLDSYLHNENLMQASDSLDTLRSFLNNLTIEEELLFLDLLYSIAKITKDYGKLCSIAQKVMISRTVWDSFVEQSLHSGEIKHIIQELPKNKQHTHNFVHQKQNIVHQLLQSLDNEIHHF